MATGAPLSLRYHSDQLNNKVVSVLREFYQTGEFCDVIIHIGNIKIHAHRVVLAAFSPYFRDYFHEAENRHKTDITLGNHLRDECVQQLVDFCYSSNITVDSESADKILTAANFLQIKEIEKLCITFLAAQQALKSEALQQQVSPIYVPSTIITRSPTQEKARRDGQRELACADTSGIGSSNTSPRQSSRPSSEPSGNGSVIVQPLEDAEMETVEVKKERDESPTDPPPFFTPNSSFSWSRPDFEPFRSGIPSFPGYLFPPIGSAFALPVTTSVQHQLLMKALTKSSPSSLEPGESREGFLGVRKYSTSSTPKDELHQSDPEVNTSTAETPSSHQCHICLKLFESISDLKTHVFTEHRDILSAPTPSPFKVMSPGRKLSTESSNNGGSSQAQKESEEYGGSNMCGTCGKSFRDPQSLKFHRYNHVLRYQCNYCGKRFSRSWNLHRHRKTHYRQLQEAGLGNDEMHAIDVETESTNQTSTPTTPAYDMEKDLILTSPYADYRNHRRDMMPFAFDMRKSAPSHTYSMDEVKETDENSMNEESSGDKPSDMGEHSESSKEDSKRD